MSVKDIVSEGRRAVAQVVERLARQDRALANARRASTEVSRRRVERDEVEIYLDTLRAPSAEASTDEWSGASARAAD